MFSSRRSFLRATPTGLKIEPSSIHIRISYLHLRLLFPFNSNPTLIYPLISFVYSLLTRGAHSSVFLPPPLPFSCLHPPDPQSPRRFLSSSRKDRRGHPLERDSRGRAPPAPTARPPQPAPTSATSRAGRGLQGRAPPAPRALPPSQGRHQPPWARARWATAGRHAHRRGELPPVSVHRLQGTPLTSPNPTRISLGPCFPLSHTSPVVRGNLRRGAGGLSIGGSQDERAEEGLLQLRVEKGRIRVPHPSGAG
jgi:hypothetical protein